MHYQVLIVGMGPVGLTAANLLGQAGIRTKIIERNEQLSAVPKALFIDDEFFRLLNAIGLRDEISAHAIYPVDFDYYSPLGFRVGHVVGRITEHHFPNRAATFQPEFEKILADNLRRFPSVDITFGEDLTGLSENAGHVSAHVRRGSDELVYNVDYVLGADGARSICRKLLGIDYDEVVKYGDRHVVIDVANDEDQRRIGFTHLGWRRNYMSLPMPGGRRRFEFSVSDFEDADDILKDETLQRFFKPYRDFRKLEVIRKVVYSFRARLAKRMSKGRVFLLGDAAHIMPVFGSQGMNSGARDANNISWKLAAVLQGKADTGILDTYHDERHQHAAQSIRIAVANGKLQAVRTPAVAILRDVTLAIVNLIPPLRRYIREMRYIPRPVVQSRLVLGSAGAATLVGRLLSNPEVCDGVGRLSLLDDEIGVHFALIGVDVTVPMPERLLELAGQLRMSVLNLHAREGGKKIAGAADLIVADNRFAEVFATHSGHWLIVRPDRVVAAASRPEQVLNNLTIFINRLNSPTA